MQKKIQKRFFLFEIIASKLSLLRREYLSSAVNVLTKSLKILNITKTDFCKLSYLQSDQ